jgi:hypothetical protein
MNHCIPSSAKSNPNRIAKADGGEGPEVATERRAIFRAILEAMLSQLEGRGIPATLMGRARLHISLLAAGPEYESELATLRSANSDFVSPSAVFEDHPERQLLFVRDKIHYTESGHRIVARMLADSILETDARLLASCGNLR